MKGEELVHNSQGYVSGQDMTYTLSDDYDTLIIVFVYGHTGTGGTTIETTVNITSTSGTLTNISTVRVANTYVGGVTKTYILTGAKKGAVITFPGKSPRGYDHVTAYTIFC